MKRLLSCALLLLVVLVFSYNTKSGNTVQAVSGGNATVTYLLCGYDDSGYNTDVVVLATYSFLDNTLSFLHIPRDTYYRGATLNKVNSIFPDAMHSGLSKEEALALLGDKLSTTLGISIDGSIGCTMQTFARLVDSIGGVCITLPQPLTITAANGEDILIGAGETLLNGERALLFVRSRQDYLTGDIARTDAQKIFLGALMRKIKNDISVSDIIKACIETGDGWTLNVKLSGIFKMIAKNRGRISNIATRYANIPGLQVSNSNGDWYYSISYTPSAKVLDLLGFNCISPLDSSGIMLNNSEPEFKKIYNSTDVATTIYDDVSLGALMPGGINR